jgi:hypothetical protein
LGNANNQPSFLWSSDLSTGRQITKRQAMKTELLIQTPIAGIVRVLPDYLEVKGCVALQYLSEVTPAQRTAAAHYLLDEGFIELAEGRIELERL